MKKQARITLKSAFEGLLLTWSEWHATIIGFGDGAGFSHTDWTKIKKLCPFDKGIEGEMHYYKFGLALGRLTWLGVIVGVVLAIVT